MPRYSRVVLQLSGGARAGRDGWGVDPARLAHLAGEGGVDPARLAHLAGEVLSVRSSGSRPGAIRLAALNYAEALDRQVKGHGHQRLVLANEQNLVTYVFDVAAKGAMRAICSGEDTGTRILG